MAIKIDIKKTIIPVEFGDLVFEFDLGDKNMKDVEKKAKEMEEKAKKYEDLSDEENEVAETEAQTFIKESFDYLLGDGAFEKIYEQTPNISFLADYFLQLVEGIGNEVSNRTKHTKRHQYLNKK